MGTKSQKQFVRKCVFCGDTGVTKQHVFPDWLKAELPRYNRHHNLHSSSFRSVGVISREAKQGDTGVMKVKIVCEACNSGWMSRYETAAKPILIPLLRGEPKVLINAEIQILCKWIALTTMMGEFLDVPTRAIPPSDRSLLMHRHQLGKSWQIWIGTSNNKQNRLDYRHCWLTLGGKDGFAIGKLPKPNAQSTQMTIGKLVIYCVSYDDNYIDFSFHLPYKYDSVLTKIYPSKGFLYRLRKTKYPMPGKMTEGQILMLARHFETMYHNR